MYKLSYGLFVLTAKEEKRITAASSIRQFRQRLAESAEYLYK